MVNTCGFFILDKKYNVLICHPTNSSVDSWSIPKGLQENNETVKAAAIRELEEETSIIVESSDDFVRLPDSPYRKAKKQLVSYLLVVDSRPPTKCDSMVNKDGKVFPEIDEFKWVSLDKAEELLHHTQASLIDKIREIIKA